MNISKKKYKQLMEAMYFVSWMEETYWNDMRDYKSQFKEYQKLEEMKK